MAVALLTSLSNRSVMVSTPNSARYASNAHDRPKQSQVFDPDPGNKRSRAKLFVEAHGLTIRRFKGKFILGKLRELAIAPVKLAVVDNNPGHHISMSIDRLS